LKALQVPKEAERAKRAAAIIERMKKHKASAFVILIFLPDIIAMRRRALQKLDDLRTLELQGKDVNEERRHAKWMLRRAKGSLILYPVLQIVVLIGIASASMMVTGNVKQAMAWLQPILYVLVPIAVWAAAIELPEKPSYGTARLGRRRLRVLDLLLIFLPTRYRVNLLGDLLSEYDERRAAEGRTAALWWFIKQVGNSLKAAIGAALSNLLRS